MYVIIGAGGHARVVYDILKTQNKKVLGFMDDNNRQLLDLPYLGNISAAEIIIEKYKDVKFIIAIGANELRKYIVEKKMPPMATYGTAIHKSSVIGSNVTLGLGTVVMAGSIINSSTNIGSHSIINTHSVVEHDSVISDYCHVSPGSVLAGATNINEGTHIGAGAIVIQGISIEKWSIVGAGAVVINNIPSFVTVVGVPAKIIKSTEKR